MNQYYYESRGKEKIRELQAEGLRSQAYHRSGAPRLGLFHGLGLLLKAIAGLLNGRKARHVKAPQVPYARQMSEE